ncbi:UNVERIFIED_CONTAM: hypothetical protein K2H54_047459 [Gekko kuhli]
MWLTKQGFTNFLKDILQSWEKAAADDITDLYNDPKTQEMELTPQEWANWCIQAIQMLKVRADRMKAGMDWYLYQQKNQMTPATPEAFIALKKDCQKNCPPTTTLNFSNTSTPGHSMSQHQGNMERPYERDQEGGNCDKWMTVADFETEFITETGDAGEIGKEIPLPTMSRAHHTQQGDPSPRGHLQTSEDCNAKEKPLEETDDCTRRGEGPGEVGGQNWRAEPLGRGYREASCSDLSGIESLSASEGNCGDCSDAGEQEINQGKWEGERRDGDEGKERATIIALPAEPTPWEEDLEEDVTTVIGGRGENVAELGQGHGQKQEVDTIALIHTAPGPPPAPSETEREKEKTSRLGQRLFGRHHSTL